MHSEDTVPNLKEHRTSTLTMWTIIFFIAFFGIMWTWNTEVRPVAKAAGTLGGMLCIAVCYRGMDRCLNRPEPRQSDN